MLSNKEYFVEKLNSWDEWWNMFFNYNGKSILGIET